jgi:hypothetical protein
VQLEELGQLKNPMTSLGIEPAAFLLVAWCLNHATEVCSDPARHRPLATVLEQKAKKSSYVGYPESKFQWAIKKETRIYFQTIYIAV